MSPLSAPLGTSRSRLERGTTEGDVSGGMRGKTDWGWPLLSARRRWYRTEGDEVAVVSVEIDEGDGVVGAAGVMIRKGAEASEAEDCEAWPFARVRRGVAGREELRPSRPRFIIRLWASSPEAGVEGEGELSGVAGGHSFQMVFHVSSGVLRPDDSSSSSPRGEYLSSSSRSSESVEV